MALGVSVRVYYPSNAEEMWKFTPQYRTNVTSMPFDEQSVDSVESELSDSAPMQSSAALTFTDAAVASPVVEAEVVEIEAEGDGVTLDADTPEALARLRSRIGP